MTLSPEGIVPVSGAPVIEGDLQPRQHTKAERNSGSRLFADPACQPAPERHGKIKVQQNHHKINVVTALSQQKFYNEYGNRKAPVRTVHILPLPHGNIKERPDKVGKAYRDQMFFYEAEVMEGFVQRVITEQPEPRNEKETGDGEAGKDLKEEEQVQARRGGSKHKRSDMDADNSQHGQSPQTVYYDVAV